MNYLILLTSLFGSLLADDLIPTPRIVGGKNVYPPFKYPWMLTLDLSGTHQCGGMVYKDNILITAAHCTIMEMEQWTVRQHRHDLSKTKEEENGKEFKVISWLPHPDYNKEKFDLNDVAIWKVDGSFGLDRMDRVFLDDGLWAEKLSGELTAIGWGRLYEKGPVADVLQEVKLPVHESWSCAKKYSKYGGVVDRNAMLCAGTGYDAKDACQGDSGGPIFKQVNNRTVLVGIVSWGYECNMPGLPGIFTKVYKFRRFVDQAI